MNDTESESRRKNKLHSEKYVDANPLRTSNSNCIELKGMKMKSKKKINATDFNAT